jgi:hypothetical protein
VIYSAVRGLRIRLSADRETILVRNYFRTHRVRWEDVDEIVVGIGSMGGVLGDAVTISRRGRQSVVAAQATLGRRNERQRVLNALKNMRPDLATRFCG